MQYTKTIFGLMVPFMLAACDLISNNDTSPEHELGEACPQIKTTTTKIVESNFVPPSEDDLKIAISGTLDAEDSAMMDVALALIDNATSADKPNVRITIASNGGETNQGLALRDAIRYYGTDKINLLCTTTASSAASFMFATAAQKYALPACEIMTHAAKANIADLDKMPKADQRRLEKSLKEKEADVTKQMKNLYQTSFNLTDMCASFLTRKDDTYLNAHDALKLGFIDAVLEAGGKMMIREMGITPIPSP